jgi:hypothetical protein
VLIAAILAWWLIGYTSSLTARLGKLKMNPHIVITAHALPGSEEFRRLAFWTNVTVEEFLSVLYVHANTRAMVPFIAAAFAVNHHSVIVRSTADTVFSTIVAFGIRCGKIARGRFWACAFGRWFGELT